MDKTSAKKGNLAITLSTFIYFLFDKGIQCADPTLLQLCQKINSEGHKRSLQSTVSQIIQQFDLSVTKEALTEFLESHTNPSDFQQEDLFSLGQQLVAYVEESLSNEANIDEVTVWLQQRFTMITSGWNNKVDNSLLQTIRQYEFHTGLPWIAKIADRTDHGLEEIWVLVEKVTDSVLCMDPYPWDDVDEEFDLPISEFFLRWKLCDSPAIHLQF